MRTLRLIVVGAGIGGLAAALALRRKGFDVRVYEQAPEYRALGASLDVGPNAIRLLDALGVGVAARQVGVRPEAIELLRWDDSALLLRAPHGAAAETYFGAPLLDFYRPDLQRVLMDALAPESVVWGARVDGVVQNEHEATVVFASGQRVATDAVIAADGIRSRVRQSLTGVDEPVFSGTVVYRGLLERDAAADIHPAGVNQYWLGPNRHAVSYWLSAGRLLAVNAAVREADAAPESWTDQAAPDEALAYFDGWHPIVLEHIRRCRTFLRGAVFVRRPLEHWSFGRVTLLGDAAHAMEPFQAQGAAQAIEDAWILAECLAGDHVVPALVEYERARMSRAQELQESSRIAADTLYLPDGDAQQQRDARYRTLLQTYPWGHRQPIWEHDVRHSVRS